jgi:hydroxyacylglutathione hydrolase
MKFTQYYLDCLSQASYLIGDESTGRAVVVDPRRDTDEYVRDAAEAGLTIELIIETHFHADFLSGHLELAAATGAEIAYSSVAETEFASRKLADGERIELGELVLEIRHTPGHTPESISIVVWEHADDAEPYGVLTGDTLFIGDVGRPDLLSSIGFTREDLADQLYDSLHDKLMTLPDATKVYPAHGAGSACGKNLSTDTWSTIGAQRTTNYALLADDKQAFFDLVTEGQPPAPSYFVYDAILNRQDRELLDEHATPTPLDLDGFEALVAGGAMIIDGRDPEEFAHGHLAGSINVGLNGRYAEFAGSVIPSDVDIVLVVGTGFETEAKNRLARIGFDRVVGFLERPLEAMAAHPDRVERASRLTAVEFGDQRGDIDGLQLVDIRNPGEVESGTIADAVTIPVGQLPARLDELDPAAPTVVYCAGGYRSSVAASVLRQAGFADVSDIIGGYGAWQEALAAST